MSGQIVRAFCATTLFPQGRRPPLGLDKHRWGSRPPGNSSQHCGEDPSQIAFSPKIGNLHRVIIGKLHGVTIRRELEHSDQIIKSEHIGTDRSRFLRAIPYAGPRTPPPPAWTSMGGVIQIYE